MEELPRILDAAGIATDQVGDEMLLQIRRNGEFASIQRSVTDTVDAGARLDLQRHEVAARARDDHARCDDFTIFHLAHLPH